MTPTHLTLYIDSCFQDALYNCTHQCSPLIAFNPRTAEQVEIISLNWRLSHGKGYFPFPGA